MALTDKLTAIGDAIRAKTGSTALIPLSDMPGEIDAVYEKGVENGKKTEYDAFWGAYLNKGNAQQCLYSFAGRCWNDKTFKPKYNIVCAYSCLGMFAYSVITDLAKTLNDCGIILDTSGASNLESAFAYAVTKTIPTVNAANSLSINGIFENCSNLESIEKFTVAETQGFTRAFTGCGKLKDIVFDGVIGNSIDMHWSTLLTRSSIESVINHLSGTATGKTLTLSKTAVENAFITEEGVAEFSISSKQSDGFYNLTFASDGDKRSVLHFAVPMNIEFHGEYLLDGNVLTSNISRNGIYSLNMEDLITFVSSDTYPIPLYDALGTLKIKRADGKDLSESDMTAYKGTEYDYQWLELIGRKSNWNIALA